MTVWNAGFDVIEESVFWTQEQFGVLADQVHIIGHSLGAHIAGYAGEKIAGLGRITGNAVLPRSAITF